MRAGELLSIVGPSGCGKSTLLRIVADLVEPSEGSVRVNGRSARQARENRNLGVVFQTPVLYEWRSVAHNVQLPLEVMGIGAASRRRFWRSPRLPVSMPLVFTALELNVNLSLIGVIIAEFFGGRHGLGREMKYAIESFNMPVAWTTIVIAAVVGTLWYQLVGAIERPVVPWDASLRQRPD